MGYAHKVFSIESFTLDITLSKFEASALKLSSSEREASVLTPSLYTIQQAKNLDYPNAMRREVCEILMQESGNVVWRIVGALQAQI